ncbi:Uncharacterised protein [Chlamydia abortus]|uniref:Maltose/maltodextrin transport system permease protein n=1 Tax=Paenibacillus residui TaxID=629724 RepID=A0ABW3D2I6_9BACL|nr:MULTISPECIES: hypothetical protein [Paenibacillaceae]SHE11637.1 Uncharacterised protein [Chlamydia abortus]
MRKLLLFLLSLAAGCLMSVFVFMSGFYKHFFSLGAVLIGIYVFKSYETKGPKIAFILLTLVFSFLLPPTYVLFAYANGWYVPPQFLEGVQ